MVELYAEATVAVVPSLYEGFSLPAVEAMACGVPLVATTGGALPEVVGEDGVTGLLVPARRCRSALAIAIETIMADAELAARLSAAARRRVLRALHLAGLRGGHRRQLPLGDRAAPRRRRAARRSRADRPLRAPRSPPRRPAARPRRPAAAATPSRPCAGAPS